MSLNDVNASPCDIRLEPHARYPESTEKKKTEKYLVSKRQQNINKMFKSDTKFSNFTSVLKYSERY